MRASICWLHSFTWKHQGRPQALAIGPQAAYDPIPVHVASSQKQRFSEQATVTQVHHGKRRALPSTRSQM